MSPAVCIAVILICALVAIAGAVWFLIELLPEGRHAGHPTADAGPSAPGDPAGPGVGSMQLDDDPAWEHRTPGNGAREYPAGLMNGHAWACLRPGEEHPGACPEEGDWPDAHDWPVPDLPVARPVAAGPDVIDAVLALEAEDPANAGWTDQLLADLRNAPTALDDRCYGCVETDDDEYPWICRANLRPPETCPLDEPGGAAFTGPTAGTSSYPPGDTSLERLADTGEIHLAGVRADWAAELEAQDYDAAEFISRMASAAAEIRVNGLA